MIGKLLVGIITHSFNLPYHLTRLNDSSLDSNSEREGEKKTSDVVSYSRTTKRCMIILTFLTQSKRIRVQIKQPPYRITIIVYFFWNAGKFKVYFDIF